MGKYKTKAIQTDLGTFRQNQACPEIIPAYTGILKTFVTPVTVACLERWYFNNPNIFRTRSIFRTLAYLQSWYIQIPRIFRTLAFSKSEVHLEPCQIFTRKRFAKLVNGYNYFLKLPNVITFAV